MTQLTSGLGEGEVVDPDLEEESDEEMQAATEKDAREDWEEMDAIIMDATFDAFLENAQPTGFHEAGAFWRQLELRGLDRIVLTQLFILHSTQFRIFY